MKPIFDTRGNQLGFVDEQGRIWDKKSHVIGYEGPNKQIVINNHVVGSTDPRQNLPFMFNNQKKNKEAHYE